MDKQQLIEQQDKAWHEVEQESQSIQAQMSKYFMKTKDEFRWSISTHYFNCDILDKEGAWLSQINFRTDINWKDSSFKDSFVEIGLPESKYTVSSSKKYSYAIGLLSQLEDIQNKFGPQIDNYFKIREFAANISREIHKIENHEVNKLRKDKLEEFGKRVKAGSIFVGKAGRFNNRTEYIKIDKETKKMFYMTFYGEANEEGTLFYEAKTLQKPKDVMINAWFNEIKNDESCELLEGKEIVETGKNSYRYELRSN